MKSDDVHQEYRVLRDEYARVQSRCTRLVQAQQARIRALESELIRSRALLVLSTTRAFWSGAMHFAVASESQGSRTARSRSVLLVGPDQNAARQTRTIVEIAGGRMLHHPGHCDEAEAGQLPDPDSNAEALERGLALADLVICQTGCMMQGAWWRVRDHCRRTGKQCVLVDDPRKLDALRLVDLRGSTPTQEGDDERISERQSAGDHRRP